jgi:ribonuclease VapC
LIVADTSAVVAYLTGEARSQTVEACLVSADAILMSAGTLTELLIVSQSRGIDQDVRDMLDQYGIEIVPVTEDAAFAAGKAHGRFGRRSHAAGLNFGDCFAYVLAKSRDLPLLYVGEDFAKTDVRSAIAEWGGG